LVAFLISVPMLDLVAPPSGAVGNALFVVAFAGLPLCIGIAILRHNLYDIDRLINRSLVYGALSVSVVGLYFLIVGGFGVLMRGRSDVLATRSFATECAVCWPRSPTRRWWVKRSTAARRPPRPSRCNQMSC
jgi:hypothetical protein